MAYTTWGYFEGGQYRVGEKQGTLSLWLAKELQKFGRMGRGRPKRSVGKKGHRARSRWPAFVIYQIHLLPFLSYIIRTIMWRSPSLQHTVLQLEVPRISTLILAPGEYVLLLINQLLFSGLQESYMHLYFLHCFGC